jgi:hypothetical protein
MTDYLKSMRLHKHPPSSISPVELFHGRRLKILYFKPIRCECYKHIQEEEHFSRSIHHLRACEAIIFCYPWYLIVYRVFTLEYGYVFMTQELIFAKMTCSQVVTMFCWNSKDTVIRPRFDSPELRTKGPHYNSICSY